jgi:hypothetical protein
LKLPPDNRLRTPPVRPWVISLLKPAFIGCNTPALNPAVNAPNIPCFKSLLLQKEMEKQHFLLLKKAFLFGFLPMMSSLLILHLWLGLFIGKVISDIGTVILVDLEKRLR